MTTPRTQDLPPAPALAHTVFGPSFDVAQQYAQRLATDATVRGLIGPREVPRLWERHLLNAAVLCDLIETGVRVVDVGSGAGLPGIPMAIRRPDLRIDLLEPMRRRTDFLTDVVAELGLQSRVRVLRGRADEPDVLDRLGSADYVVARAVAPLDRLVRWCLPLLRPDGRLLALKGSGAADEVAQHEAALHRSGAGAVEVVRMAGDMGEPTWVVAVSRAAARSGRMRGAP